MKAKKSLLILLTLMGSLLISCGGKTPTIIINSSSNNNNSTDTDDFSYESPGSVTSVNPISSSEEQGFSIDWSKYNFKNLVTVNDNGTFIAEAEDLDLSQATMQELCDHFYEYPSGEAKDITSGGACIACVASPTILGFKFDLEADCDITFIDRCAKYEEDYSLNANATFWCDENAPFTFSYSSFGHTDTNQWYNWKDVEIGSAHLNKGTHMFQIQITGQFANTDCFKLVVTNYGN